MAAKDGNSVPPNVVRYRALYHIWLHSVAAFEPGVIRKMICEKCNKQFKSEIPISESRKMIGLCRSCGTRLKYDDIPEGFVGGALMLFVSTPLFFISLLNWKFLVSSIAIVGVASFSVLILTKKYGGYLVTESIAEYRKGNLRLAFLGGLAGFLFSLLWCFLAMELLV